MSDWFRTALKFVRERWQWLIGALMVAAALYGKRVAENREKTARERLTDVNADRLGDIYEDQDTQVDRFNESQRRNRDAEHRLNRRLDEIAKDTDDTARVISDWNAANRLRDGENAT